MCIAIYKPEGIRLLESTLNNCFEANSDGAGFAYSNEDNKVVIEKGFFSLKAFEKAYQPHELKQCLVHFRIKTHGALNAAMCHPFAINDHIAMIHNGIICQHGSKDKSDTYEFVEEIIKPMVQSYGDRILADPIMQNLLDKYINASKLMFLNTETKEHHIINSAACNVNSECVFSNYSWQERKAYIQPASNSFDFEYGHNSHNNYGQRTRFQKKKTSCKEIKNYQNIEFKINDFAKLKWDTALAGNKGDVVIIEQLYTDYTADIYNMNADSKISAIGVAMLELPEEKDLLCLN